MKSPSFCSLITYFSDLIEHDIGIITHNMSFRRSLSQNFRFNLHMILFYRNVIFISNCFWRIVFTIRRCTFVMHQDGLFADIISMEILNLEVICCLRAFKQLMLNLLDNDILAIEHNENITGSEVNGTCPPLNR